MRLIVLVLFRRMRMSSSVILPLAVVLTALFVGAVHGNVSPAKRTSHHGGKHVERDNFDKKGKKDLEDDNNEDSVVLVTPSTTERPEKKEFVTLSHPPQNEKPLEATKTQKIIELTAIFCSIVVGLIVAMLSIRLFCYTYEKVCKARNIPRSGRTEEASVHYTNGGRPGGNPCPSNGTGTTPNIYTVMPGHFVLQPCYATTSSASVNAVATPHSSSQTGDGVQMMNYMRPETPPPPYPGLSVIPLAEKKFP